MQASPRELESGLFVSSEHPEALIDPEKLLKVYFDSPNIGFCILDPAFRYLAINKTLAVMNNLPAEAHLGKSVREILGVLADAIEDKFRQVIEKGKPISLEIAGQAASQNEGGHWTIHFLPIRDNTDKIARVGAVVLDLTVQKKLEVSLEKIGGQLKQETDRLQVLTDVGSLLSSNRDVSQVFPTISARIRRVLCQEFASFSLRDEKTGLLVHRATDFPFGKGLLPQEQVSMNNTPPGKAMQAHKGMIFTKEQLQGFDDEMAKGLLAEGLQALCCVPLMRPRGPLGVITWGSTRASAFQTNDLDLIHQVAAQLAVAIENHRAANEIDQLKRRLGEERRYLEGETRIVGQFSEIIGNSPILKRVLDQVETVSSSEATVLILGETGAGKELVAHAIHRLSQRSRGPFIKLNCAAIPTGLLESELFGHEKGAFTGAIMRKIGHVELADGGTLFLDEVGEIPIELQPKLLRVLRDQEFERLGSNRTIKVNLRVVSATNRNLEESISRHEFSQRSVLSPARLPDQVASIARAAG